ncbi:LysR family transcriptional regulator [Rouxiella badensis]|uniref:LysR family transcriptional regulator n=1 Tax=Rouxiella badensis TaxID=1646377 RepID=UPI00036AAFAB|nr:LysR family transcriptional regulator [Rouxiella badensis]MCC3720185.1 LysR family transcriptional regulator [Rouxiella badensis]MCC3729848.1 LysR family transcriptional regulator [Rouxiella badensis]MCC3741335.1 LysR family transcriptional regulator [Rouxiella badensis]
MLRELKTFIAVTQDGTFAAAGQRIGLTQSAVSAQIRGLEDYLGMTLFDRTGRSAVLNAAGSRILPMAEQILEIFASMSQPESLGDFRGVIKIGAISTFQTGLLPQVLVKLHQSAPALETKLVPGVSFNLLTQVDAGNIDLAIVIKPGFPLAKDLHSETLAREPFVLIAPTHLQGEDPIALLREQPFIRYDRTSFGGRMVSQFLRSQRLEPKVVLEIDEIDAIVKMVENGLGVALVPLAGLWLERKANLRVVSLDELTFHRELILVMRHAHRQSPLHMLIGRCLHDVAQTSLSHQ